MSRYRLWFHPTLVAPTLLYGDNHQAIEHNDEIFLVGAAQKNFPDGFPKNVDPHWSKYPIDLWYPGINLITPYVVWTQFKYDKNHYLMYVTNNEEPEKVITYRTLLRSKLFLDLLKDGKGTDYTALLEKQAKTDKAQARKNRLQEIAAAAQKNIEDREKERKRQAALRNARADERQKRQKTKFGKKR